MVCSHVSVSFVGGRWCCVGCGEVVDYVGSGASEEFLRLYGSEKVGVGCGGLWAERWYAHSYDGARLFFVVKELISLVARGEQMPETVDEWSEVF